MTAADYRFHTLVRRDLVWLIPLMFAVWAALAMVGIGVDLAFLAGVSSATIGVTAFAYRDAYRDIRFWATLAFFCLAHVLIFCVVGGSWIPKPAAAVTPLFLVDYMAMAYLLPKISRIKFAFD